MVSYRKRCGFLPKSFRHIQFHSCTCTLNRLHSIRERQHSHNTPFNIDSTTFTNQIILYVRHTPPYSFHRISLHSHTFRTHSFSNAFTLSFIHCANDIQPHTPPVTFTRHYIHVHTVSFFPAFIHIAPITHVFI